MPCVINPAGRIVAIDDVESYEHWIKQPGFRRATEQEEIQYVASKQALIRQMEKEKEMIDADANQSVYLATVTMGGNDGYGKASEHIYKELQKLGVNISNFKKYQKIGFLFHSPQSLVRLENPFKIVMTMFESDKIPDEWQEYLQDADKVIVPSRWCQDVFARAGVHTEVVPLGYNHHVYKYQERQVKRDNRGDFVFLHYNAFNIRKGFLEVYEGFRKAFDPSEPVKLVLKTTASQPYSRFPFISQVKDPKVVVLEGGMSDEEVAKLLGTADCFVFPSRGEGFGLTPLEAMATGLPAIVPNAHGISEYFSESYMYEVKVKEQCPAIYARYKGQDVGNMVICDSDHLAQQMRYIYEHQEEALEKGKMAAEYVKQWTYEKTAKRLKEVFDEYLQKEAVEKPLNNILLLEQA